MEEDESEWWKSGPPLPPPDLAVDSATTECATAERATDESVTADPADPGLSAVEDEKSGRSE